MTDGKVEMAMLKIESVSGEADALTEKICSKATRGKLALNKQALYVAVYPMVLKELYEATK